MAEVTGISKSKTVCIILVVIGCFGVLWPKIFYPMIKRGLNWKSEAQYALERTAAELMLPPKVREAMGANPMRESAKVHKLPGRAQFYTSSPLGHSGTPNQPTQNSYMNLMMPVYTIVVIIFFLYIMLRMSFNNDDSSPSVSRTKGAPVFVQKPTKVDPMFDELNRFEDPSLRSRIRAAKMGPSYQAFRNTDRDKMMRALVDDMETFRTHLQEAQVCMCKIKKYELAKKVTEMCLKEGEEQVLVDKEEPSVLNQLSNEEIDISETSESKIVQNDEDDEFEDCNNENLSPENELEQSEAETNSVRLRHRKAGCELHSIENQTQCPEETEQTDENISEQFHAAFDSNVLDHWSQEMNRLVHSKNE